MRKWTKIPTASPHRQPAQERHQQEAPARQGAGQRRHLLAAEAEAQSLHEIDGVAEADRRQPRHQADRDRQQRQDDLDVAAQPPQRFEQADRRIVALRHGAS
jgi:hypothetical protein